MVEGKPGRCAAALGAAVGPAGTETAGARPGGISGPARPRDRGKSWRWRIAICPTRSPGTGIAAPALAAQALFEPWWRRRRTALFSRYDAIVCAPGPYLADYDARATSALCDIAVASELGLRVVLSSHSVGPLRADGLAALARATARIAREPSTYHYLREHGLSAVLSADLAFLYPYIDTDAETATPAPVRPPYRVVFLRSNNLDASRLRLEDGALFEGSRLIAEASSDQLVLATSDYRRDGRFLARAARRLRVPWVAVPECQ